MSKQTDDGLTMNQLAERNAEYVMTIAELEDRCAALAVENAQAKERHLFIRALAVSIIEHSGGRMDWRGAMEDATELLKTVDSVYAKKPATDAFLAEVRAQGVEMAITVVNDCSNNICAGGLAENRQYEESIVNPYLDGIHDELQEFAAQLRKGAAL